MEGVRVGVTAARRAEQLAEALRRRGAEVVVGPTLGGDRAEADEKLVGPTDAIIAAHPDWLVANTGMGMRLWAEAAERTGRLEGLIRTAARATCIARGAKAVGGLRKLQADAEWMPKEQTDSAVVDWLLEQLSPGQTVAVQLHGGPVDHPYERLAGQVELLTVLPYRSVLPDDIGPARDLIRQTLSGEVDVLTFTSPGAVRGLWSVADEMGDGTRGRLAETLRGPVAVAAVGVVTASGFDPHQVPVTIMPDRPRTGDLVRAVEAWAEGSRGGAGSG